MKGVLRQRWIAALLGCVACVGAANGSAAEDSLATRLSTKEDRTPSPEGSADLRRQRYKMVSTLESPNFRPAASYFVSPQGDDQSGDGSASKPWASLRRAVQLVPDNGSEIVFRMGVYAGGQMINRQFSQHLLIRAEQPYRARLQSSASQHRVLMIRGGANVLISGLEMCGAPGATDDYLIQVTGGDTHDIVFEDNIFHDSYQNDIMKINSRALRITVRGNVFYNQPRRGDEHIDVNTVRDVVIEDNVFFNDFAASGRPVDNNTHPYVLIKNSGSQQFSRDFIVRRNIFLHWQGLSDQPFLLLGEDGKAFHEAQHVLVENNIFLCHTSNPMTAAFAVKGVKDVTFRANTVLGKMILGSGSWGYAMRLGREGSNPPNENIFFWNNVWADPTGSMTHFSSGSPANTIHAAMRRNLYFHGGKDLPPDANRVLNAAKDPEAIVADPRLDANLDQIATPVWKPAEGRFQSGQASIAEVRHDLATRFAAAQPGSPIIDAADPKNMPGDDVLAAPRDSRPDLGALEYRP